MLEDGNTSGHPCYMFPMSSNPNRLPISQMAAARPPAPAADGAPYLNGLNPEQREAVLHYNMRFLDWVCLGRPVGSGAHACCAAP